MSHKDQIYRFYIVGDNKVFKDIFKTDNKLLKLNNFIYFSNHYVSNLSFRMFFSTDLIK